MGILDRLSLPTLDDVNRIGRACPKGPSRLADRKQDDRDAKKAEAAFRREVIKRDGRVCRCCEREVKPSLRLEPRRLEVHHIYGRVGAFRYAVAHALVLCSECHERVTGTVGVSRLFIVQVAAFMVTVDGRSLVDAGKPVRFEGGNDGPNA